MNLFGMPTLIEAESLDKCALLCSSLGLDFIELNMNLPEYQVQVMEERRFKEVSEKYGVTYTIHLDENLDVSDFNPYIADAHRRTALETIDFAKKLNIPVLNMHISRGVYFTLPEQKVFLYRQFRERYLSSIISFRDECEDRIGSSNITVCIENTNGYFDFQLEAIELLLKSPVFGLTLDIGHNHRAGCADEPFVLRHRDRLRHTHFHDSIGGKDHLALGSGEIDVMRYLSLAEEQGCSVVLETKTIAGLSESVSYLNSL